MAFGAASSNPRQRCHWCRPVKHVALDSVFTGGTSFQNSSPLLIRAIGSPPERNLSAAAAHIRYLPNALLPLRPCAAHAQGRVASHPIAQSASSPHCKPHPCPRDSRVPCAISSCTAAAPAQRRTRLPRTGASAICRPCAAAWSRGQQAQRRRQLPPNGGGGRRPPCSHPFMPGLEV